MSEENRKKEETMEEPTREMEKETGAETDLPETEPAAEQEEAKKAAEAKEAEAAEETAEDGKERKFFKKKKDKKNTSKSVPKSGAYSEYSAADSNNDDNELSAPNRVSLEKPFSENSLSVDGSLENSAFADSVDNDNSTESRFVGYNLVKEDEFDE